MWIMLFFGYTVPDSGGDSVYPDGDCYNPPDGLCGLSGISGLSGMI